MVGRARSSVTPARWIAITDTVNCKHSLISSCHCQQVLGGLLLGDARALAERVSEGRSGSLFYYSHDHRSHPVYT